MHSRQERVIKGALTGGAAGFLVGGTVGYLFNSSTVCSFVPGYFDTLVAQSSEQFKSKLSLATATQEALLKEKLGSMMGNSNYFTEKLPSFTNHLPSIGAYVSKTLSISHPILTSLSYAALEISTEVIKATLVATCVNTLESSPLIPALCITSTLFGAGLGALIGYTRTSPAFSSREEIKHSLLRSQSLFNNKLNDKTVKLEKYNPNKAARLATV